MKNVAILFSLIAATTACKKKPAEKAPEPTAGSGSAAAAPTTGSAGSGSAGSAAAPPAAWDGKSPLSLTDGFQPPESVLYDPDADMYYVSNINGEALGADDNGYISKVS